MVVIDGPRFSTRAESRWYAEQGWSVVNMTGHPEAVLARELALCYANVALVTDLDAGVDAESSVSMEAIFEVFAEHIDELKAALTRSSRTSAPTATARARRRSTTWICRTGGPERPSDRAAAQVAALSSRVMKTLHGSRT